MICFLQNIEKCASISTYRVHCENLSSPVKGGSKPPQLLVDDVAFLLFPVEHLLQELVPADVVTTHPPALFQPPLHHRLGSYPRVIQSWHPDHVSTQHPVPAHKQISMVTFRDCLVKFCNYGYKWLKEMKRCCFYPRQNKGFLGNKPQSKHLFMRSEVTI